MIHRLFCGQRNWVTKVLFIAFLCALSPVSTSLSAAEENVTPAMGLNAKGLLFTFNGLAMLGTGAFNGGIGGKFFFMENIAGRAGVQFLMVNKTVPANPPVGVAGTDGSQSAFQIGISPAIEYHLSKARLSPFIGGGILFSSTSTKNKSAVTGGAASVEIQNAANGENIDNTVYYAGMTFGISGLGGVEFFITNEISLSAEYQVGFSLISRYPQKVVNGVETKVGSRNTFGISNNGNLTVAFYF
jgi:hypothetical protein